jgi:steroid delta-isomerase-like uncharacterized protein
VGDPAGAASRRLQIVRQHISAENTHALDQLMATFGMVAAYDDEPWDEHHRGRDAVRAFYADLFQAVPDVEIDVLREHEAGDAVVVESLIRGTHHGAWRGLPPTGQRIELPLCGVFTFSDDGSSLAGERIYYDRATLLRQLGVFREPAGPVSRLLLFLNHPVTISAAWLRSLLARPR